MPSTICSFLFALNAMAFITVSDFSRPAAFALASPLPISFVTRTVDHQSNNPGKTYPTVGAPPGLSSVSRPVIYSRVEHLEYRKTSDKLSVLRNYYHKANVNAGNLKSLAVRSSSVAENDHVFQQDCVSQLTEFNTNVLGFQSILGELSSQKGLGYYHSNNDLETLLKDLINANKSALSDISKIIGNLPILGPILGPIVYELKCILDDILNICESLTDIVINALQPLLKDLL